MCNSHQIIKALGCLDEVTLPIGESVILRSNLRLQKPTLPSIKLVVLPRSRRRIRATEELNYFQAQIMPYPMSTIINI